MNIIFHTLTTITRTKNKQIENKKISTCVHKNFSLTWALSFTSENFIFIHCKSKYITSSFFMIILPFFFHKVPLKFLQVEYVKRAYTLWMHLKIPTRNQNDSRLHNFSLDDIKVSLTKVYSRIQIKFETLLLWCRHW